MLVELFVARPALAPEMLADVPGLTLPAFGATSVSSADATDRLPTEYRADAVITLTDGGRSVLGVIVEPQLRPAAARSIPWWSVPVTCPW